MFRSAATVHEPRTGPDEFLVIRAARAAKPDSYVPRRFEDALTLHFVKNMLAPQVGAPLLLLIQGPAGEGKSVQTVEVCARLGVDLVVIPGFALSGEHEKEPVDILRRAYIEASTIRQVSRRPVMLLIEDLDTSVASVAPGGERTMNSQLVTGALMSLTQDPYHFGEVVTDRVPMLATGNDLTNLYGPLMRHGRATIIDWVPETQERVQVVRHIFKNDLSEGELARVELLVEHFSRPEEVAPIAFYEVLRNAIFDDAIVEAIHSAGGISWPNISRTIDTVRPRLTVEQLIALGEQVRSATPRRFLSGSSALK